ncbi:MAG: hypothetical protein R3F15_18370 [Lysobacterales bacterium]
MSREEREDKNHIWVNRGQITLKSIGDLVFLCASGVKAFDLHWAQQDVPGNRLGNHEIKTYISLWEIDSPASVSEYAGDI